MVGAKGTHCTDIFIEHYVTCKLTKLCTYILELEGMIIAYASTLHISPRAQLVLISTCLFVFDIEEG